MLNKLDKFTERKAEETQYRTGIFEIYNQNWSKLRRKLNQKMEKADK